MSDKQNVQESFWQRLAGGQYALALKYWTLYLIVAVIFFVSGSMAVAEERWRTYLTLLGLTVAWTFVLLVGVKRGYRGQDPGKAISRVAILFLLLNLSNALATLSFI